jgi:hypothetical protein
MFIFFYDLINPIILCSNMAINSFFLIKQFSIGTNLLFVVKAYAITALTKIYAFEIAAGRKVDMLSEVFAEKI